MSKVMLFLFVFIPQFLFANVIKNDNHFKTIGAISSFSWAPARYQNDFRYDIFYYIPATLKDASNVNALIFNHGGGDSTLTREGSIWAVNLYIDDLKKMADDLGIIVVLPSANGLNWGSHTRGLMRDLATMMRTELDINPNKLGLSGHSMGGMGITRNYLWGADEFAFFLPMAAGMDVAIQNEQMLNKVFNVPYVHLQGKDDHFDIFVTRCEEQLKRTRELEVKYGVPSKLEMIFYNGSHNYDYNLFRSNLQKLYDTAPRNLYQKELWGSLHIVKTMLTENNISYDYDSEPRYFWIELMDMDLSAQELLNFHAKITGNRIDIDFESLPTKSKTLRVYLSSQMLDLHSMVEIYMNGNLVITRYPSVDQHKVADERDPGFKFEDYIDIKL